MGGIAVRKEEGITLVVMKAAVQRGPTSPGDGAALRARKGDCCP